MLGHSRSQARFKARLMTSFGSAADAVWAGIGDHGADVAPTVRSMLTAPVPMVVGGVPPHGGRDESARGNGLRASYEDFNEIKNTLGFCRAAPCVAGLGTERRPAGSRAFAGRKSGLRR